MSGMAHIVDLPLTVLKQRLASGSAKSIEICEALLKRIEATDGIDRSIAWIDPDYARRIAKSRDGYRVQGRALGSLHGLPVLIDDSFDLARVPMKRGLAALDGALSERDSPVVASLRAAGAQLFGKSAIPTLRVGAGEDGAVAIVAKRCFPLAVTVDARGELIAAAGLHGVYGYRPSPGLITCSHLLDIAPSLDGVTLLAAELAGLAMLADALFESFTQDPARDPRPRPMLAAAVESPPPVAPVIAFLTDEREAAQAAASELTEALGDRAFSAELPPVFADVAAQSERIVKAEGARCLKPFERRFGSDLPEDVRAFIADGEAISAIDYLGAKDWMNVLSAGMNEIFERCNVAAMIGPIDGVATSVAPERLAAFIGLPALTLPILEAPDGAPLGLTFLAKAGEDARLLQTAAWLLKTLNGEHA